MKQTKDTNAITLIALVITIIVLLILAGVTIATLTGDNGLLSKTSDAQFKTEIAQYKEELKLSILTDEANTYSNREQKFNETEYNKIKRLIPSFSRKYDNVLVIEEDKLVYKGKDEDFYRIAVNSDLISDNELLDDEILQELKPFITIWKTTEANESVTIPIQYINADINWGDNSPIEHVTANNPTHIYNEPGEYEILITGSVDAFSGNATQLVGIKQWGTLSCRFLQFDNCTNLTGSIPEPSKNSFNSLYNLYEGSLRFKGCVALTGPIPEKLLINVKTTYFRDMFNGCTSLTYIPENLFKYNTKVEDFRRVFLGCTGITSIPKNLFKNNTEATNFQNAFGGCTGITSIPEDLFKNNTKTINFDYLFINCTGITSIPENLFINQKNVAKNYECCFRGCSNLENIPSGLFKNCKVATNFGCVFMQCSKITKIPDALFKNCEKATNFSYAFSYTGIVTVPTDLFSGCISITSFGHLFDGSTGLKNKEIELTIESENVTDFNQMFYAVGAAKVTLNIIENSTTYETISTRNNTYTNNLVINTYSKE